MYNILIDIGNSNIKLGKGSSKNFDLSQIKTFSYSKENFNRDFRINFQLNNKYKFYNVGISVSNEEVKKILSVYFKKINLEPVFIDRNMNLPIKIKYAKGLGNDRICNAVAAHILYGEKNTLIIDYGTATTYTMLSNRVLIGGMISPGINTSLNSLIEYTSLPKPALSFPRNILNDNTLDNIKAGILFQSLFSTEKTIMELSKKFKNLFVVATGGYSNIMAQRTNLINTVDKNLVLKGINILISQ